MWFISELNCTMGSMLHASDVCVKLVLPVDRIAVTLFGCNTDHLLQTIVLGEDLLFETTFLTLTGGLCRQSPQSP